MVELKQKQEILLRYMREGHSRRRIARDLGVHRGTVGKYIDEYEKSKVLLVNAESKDTGELIQSLVEQPTYNSTNRKKRKLTPEIIERIKQHLEENVQKKMNGMSKQQKKAIDIYESLESEGYDISYTTVRRTVNEFLHVKKEAYIKGDYFPGDVCEFDWGEVKLFIDGHKRTFQMAVFTPAYSNFRIAYLFTKQKTECFLEAHALFIKEVDCVHRTMVYDNMKVAVKRFVGNEKEPTDALLKLSIYYSFGYRFCNAERGNEKGHVEKSVEMIRRKAFAHKDTFHSLEEANQYLYDICMKLNQKSRTSHANLSPLELLQEERQFLPQAPLPFDSARVSNGRVTKYSTVIIDSNHYSVPDHLVDKLIRIKIYSNTILCFYEEEKIATHARLLGHSQWSLQLPHYLETIQKKPGALAGSAALQQANKKIQQIYYSYYTTQPREFVELLHFIESGITVEHIEKSIQELYKINPTHVTTDKIKMLCLSNNNSEKTVIEYTSEATITIEEQAELHLRKYANLFQTTGIVH